MRRLREFLRSLSVPGGGSLGLTSPAQQVYQAESSRRSTSRNVARLPASVALGSTIAKASSEKDPRNSALRATRAKAAATSAGGLPKAPQPKAPSTTEVWPCASAASSTVRIRTSVVRRHASLPGRSSRSARRAPDAAPRLGMAAAMSATLTGAGSRRYVPGCRASHALRLVLGERIVQPLERRVEGRHQPAQVLLLCACASQVAAARVMRVGEVEADLTPRRTTSTTTTTTTTRVLLLYTHRVEAALGEHAQGGGRVHVGDAQRRLRLARLQGRARGVRRARRGARRRGAVDEPGRPPPQPVRRVDEMLARRVDARKRPAARRRVAAPLADLMVRVSSKK
eukprot:scaffold22754_cov68-Phaeocystis_antarctica.AAC.3